METSKMFNYGTMPFGSIASKTDAIKYAFDLTTQRNLSTGEVKIDIEKAMQVYKTFIDNVNLPDVTSTYNPFEILSKRMIETNNNQSNTNCTECNKTE